MKKIACCFISVVVLAVACNKSDGKENAKYAGLKKAEWLVGNWEQKIGSGVLSEQWEKRNDSTYFGVSYFIKGKDTLHNEVMELSERKGQITYSPTVQGQNNNRPVAFKLTSITDGKIIFENKGHDYPQKITYSQIRKDSMVATISGIQQGKPSLEKYSMTKQ